MATLRKQQQGQVDPEQMQLGGGQGMGGAMGGGGVRPRQPATMTAKPGMSAAAPPPPGQQGPFQPMPQIGASQTAQPMLPDAMAGVKPRGPAQGLAAVQGAMGGGANGGQAPDVLAQLMQMLQGRGRLGGL